jgi:hypothetical protein
MTETINLICFSCIHRRNGWDGGGCDAFPDGIPDQIIETNKHDKPLKEQENEIVFEPIKPE